MMDDIVDASSPPNSGQVVPSLTPTENGSVEKNEDDNYGTAAPETASAAPAAINPFDYDDVQSASLSSSGTTSIQNPFDSINSENEGCAKNPIEMKDDYERAKRVREIQNEWLFVLQISGGLLDGIFYLQVEF